MTKKKGSPEGILPSKSITEAAKASPTSVFEAPDMVAESNDLSKKEKIEILEHWETDAKALQTATNEGMSGGERSRLDEVKAAQTKLTSKSTKRKK